MERGPPTALALHPNGTRLFSGDVEGTLRCWDTLSKQVVLELHEHNSRIEQLHFMDEGRFVVSCDAEGTIRIWDGSPDSRQYAYPLP
jgi:WD40 repeat protein